MKSALLILAHGSPRPSANAPVYRVAEAIRARAQYDLVQVGFLDCNEPDISAAIDLCAESGAGRVVALPYFLHTGNHVSEDLPTLLEAGRARHPRIEFLLADYLGSSPALTEILACRAESAIGRTE